MAETVGTAYQYKIRLQKSQEKEEILFPIDYTKLNLNLNKAKIKAVTIETAKAIILKYEWLGTMSNTTHHYGIFFDDICGGVVCYGNSCTANFNVPKEFGLDTNELFILARGACCHWTPIGSASKLISKSLLLLKKEIPSVKVILAYSDIEAGEIGTVYQATNWYYIGKSDHITYNFYHPQTKRRFDERMLHELKGQFRCSRGEMAEILKKYGYIKIPKPIKHKYIYILATHKEKKQILKKVTVYPYPKRNAMEGSRENCVSSTNEGLGRFQDTAYKKEVLNGRENNSI